MKKNLLIATVLLSGSLLAQHTASHSRQYVTPEQYDQLKRSHQLTPNTQYLFVMSDNEVSRPSMARNTSPVQIQSTVCNCLIPLDTTFSVVPFVGYTPPDYRNDDGYSISIALPFSFNFYGTLHDSLYINNNGNISFASPYSTFTANAFPDSTYDMIAPFWADVDTRDSASGLVYYQISPTHLIVKWDSVGYYSGHSNLKNTFQLIITDGLDSILPAGTNVAFCYGDMQWTTGDASMGNGGFGGTPSTVGVNMGNGTDYFQVTRNDSSGYTFDGPYNNPDGVSWLDDQEIYFNTAISGNVPPLVMNNTICDTIDVYTGDTLRTMNVDSVVFEFYFTTPEPNQTVTASLNCPSAPAAFSYQQTLNLANCKVYSCVFRAKDLPPGVYTVQASATDDGVPAATSTGTVTIHTYYDGTLGIQSPLQNNGLNMYPNPAGEQLTIERGNDQPAAIIITDPAGRECSRTITTGNRTIVNTAPLSKGMYFVTVIENNGQRQTSKLIRR